MAKTEAEHEGPVDSGQCFGTIRPERIPPWLLGNTFRALPGPGEVS